jgi:acyl-homoserine-lactone acylase
MRRIPIADLRKAQRRSDRVGLPALILRRGGWVLLALLLIVLIGLMTWEPFAATPGSPPPARAYSATITRDEFGVPHIHGRTDPDVAFGVAWAHSEDDFATLQDVLAMTRGRYGAIAGESGAATDFALALLDARGTAKRRYPELPADVRALMDAYASGLNHYAAKHPQEIKLARLFPVDGVDVATGFALRQPFFFGLDKVIKALAEEKPFRAEQPPAVLGGVAWYELVIDSDSGWHFAGANFPGSPYPFLGHNETLGWTNTVNRADLYDVYKLVLNDARTHYRLDGKWLPLTQRTVTLPVRFGPLVLPVRRTVYATKHGPAMLNARGGFAFRYAGIDSIGSLTQYYRLTKARNLAEWTAAMRQQAIPATNFVYADREGNIALVYNAQMPLRKPGYDWRGVVPGDRSDLIWTTTARWADLPKLVNPASGFLFNANNTPFVAAGPGSELDPKAFDPSLGIELDTTNRARRAVKLMSAARPLGRLELMRIKYDKGYERAGYVAWMLDAVAKLDLRGEPELQRAQKLLATWDLTADGIGRADTLAVLVLQEAMSSSYGLKPAPDPKTELENRVKHLMKHFGRIDPPLGEVLRLRQGPGRYKVDLPMLGGGDTLRAATMWKKEEPDGRLPVRHGDSFIQFVEWPAAGPVTSRSIQPFGAATTRPDSPHYTDQAPLFAAQRTKPVHFTRADIAAHAVRRHVVRNR